MIVGYQPLNRKPMFKGNKKGANPSVYVFLTHTIGAGGTFGTNKSRKELTPLREPSASHSRSIKVTSFVMWEQELQAQYLYLTISVFYIYPFVLIVVAKIRHFSYSTKYFFTMSQKKCIFAFRNMICYG